MRALRVARAHAPGGMTFPNFHPIVQAGHVAVMLVIRMQPGDTGAPVMPNGATELRSTAFGEPAKLVPRVTFGREPELGVRVLCGVRARVHQTALHDSAPRIPRALDALDALAPLDRRRLLGTWVATLSRALL